MMNTLVQARGALNGTTRPVRSGLLLRYPPPVQMFAPEDCTISYVMDFRPQWG